MILQAAEPARDDLVEMLVSRRHKLVCVLVPKCASTTMVATFAVLHGLPVASKSRSSLDVVSLQQFSNEHEVAMIRMARSEFSGAYIRFREYTWFSIVRNPYKRLLSGYLNKINRYVKKYHKGIYLKGKIRKIFMGPTAWRSRDQLYAYYQAKIGFEGFVSGLCENGIDWDVHFARQADHLRADIVSYGALIRLENIDADLLSFMASAGIDGPTIERLGELRRLNNSVKKDGKYSLFSDNVREKILSLYADDFDFLGYERSI